MSAKTPAEVDQRLSEALAAGDAASAASLYEPGATFVNDGVPITGIDGIRAVLEGFAAIRPAIVMDVVRVIEAGDIALVFNDWSLTATAPDGTAVERSGHALEVMRRQPGDEWKYVIDDPNGRSP